MTTDPTDTGRKMVPPAKFVTGRIIGNATESIADPTAAPTDTVTAGYPTIERLADLTATTVQYQGPVLVEEAVRCWRELADCREWARQVSERTDVPAGIRKAAAGIAQARLAAHTEQEGAEPLPNTSDEERVRDLAQRMIGRWNGPSEMLLGFLRLLIRPAPSAASGLGELRLLVEAQARAQGLWFDADTIPEAYLQAGLRKLHEAVERVLRSHQAPVGEENPYLLAGEELERTIEARKK